MFSSPTNMSSSSYFVNPAFFPTYPHSGDQFYASPAGNYDLSSCAFSKTQSHRPIRPAARQAWRWRPSHPAPSSSVPLPSTEVGRYRVFRRPRGTVTTPWPRHRTARWRSPYRRRLRGTLACRPRITLRRGGLRRPSCRNRAIAGGWTL